jgi:ABC-type branched-subunit amino acid transport system ATPase component
VALIAIIPIGAPWFALLAAGGLEVIPAYINLGKINDYTQILFGVSAVLAPLTLARHPGAPKPIRRLAESLNTAIPHRTKPPTPTLDVPHVVRGVGLEIRDLTVRYGGAIAVSELSLTAPTGKITGLIGPNGAGKTTTFNAACGLLRPSEGRILLHGNDVSALGPAARARRGLGRTFQRVELFTSLTVRENIQLGREAILAGANPLTQLVASPSEQTLTRAAAEQAITLTDTTPILEQKVGDISTGQRRLVELARVLAGPFDMILLDEPSSGLDAPETEHFGHILSQVTSQWGTGILLVEHDMALVRQVCDQVWVLDFGQLIYQGSAHAMLESAIVKAAYLGSEATPPPTSHDTPTNQPQQTTTGTVLQ